MVDPLDSASIANRKAVAEIRKLRYEVLKAKVEIRNLRRRPIFHPSAYIPIISALIVTTGSLGGLLYTTQLKNEAVAQKKEAVSEKQEQASVSAVLQQHIQQTPGSPLTTVTFRFRGALSREKVTALQLNLNSNDSRFVVLAPQRTAEVVGSSLTYYDPNDKAVAEAVYNRVTSFFNQQGCPINLQLIASPNQESNKRGTILLEIYHSC